MLRQSSFQLRTLVHSSVFRKSPRLEAFSCHLSHSPLRTAPFLQSFFTTDSVHGKTGEKPKVEDILPIATGHEREELEAELEGKEHQDIDHPFGPFGTKEEPAVVKSMYDKRIVGCPGGEGDDEHDVVWFWLEKDKPHECPICSQYFVLEVVGEGGDPEEGHHSH